MRSMMNLFFMVTLLNSTKVASQLNLPQLTDTVEKKNSFRLLPQNFYNQNLGYFCKKEMQLQKFTSLPIYIRLGSKEYVDYLERKPNALKKD